MRTILCTERKSDTSIRNLVSRTEPENGEHCELELANGTRDIIGAGIAVNIRDNPKWPGTWLYDCLLNS